MSAVELLGYVASVLVAVSLMMSSLVKLRWINLVGAAAFAIYGGMVSAYPVMIVNGFIVVVNVVYLSRMKKLQEYFTLMPIRRAENSYLEAFLKFHQADMREYFPNFDLSALVEPKIAFILRNMNAAGVVVYEQSGEDVKLHLDYVLPSYRDMRCAHFFMAEMADEWRSRGIGRILTPVAGQAHRKYLQRLGYHAIEGEKLDNSDVMVHYLSSN
ncbi:MAG: hypothetical protein ACI9UK_000321 [Candidatus Krumholzibacteriia bacterium]|jgi:hypothetical protein